MTCACYGAQAPWAVPLTRIRPHHAVYMDSIRPLVGPSISVPLATDAVHAGFPSPAEDHAEEGLDLTRRFIRHPTSSFIVRAAGVSLTGRGILAGDYLVVDRSREPRDGEIVIAIVDGSFTAKIMTVIAGRRSLIAAHPGYPPIPWSEGCEIWGTVTSVHRDLTATGR